MVNQEDRDVPLVREFFQKPDILIVICVQIAGAASASNALQRVDHNQFCIGMFGQELLDLLFQSVL